MKFLKKYIKTDNPVIWIYENLLLVILANLSFILSYHIRFLNINNYNYKPFLVLAPFYSIIVIIFNNYFGLFDFKTYKDLIIKTVKSVLLITMCSMAVAYMFREGMQGIPTSVFIISTIINGIIFVEIMKQRGIK